MSLVFFVFPGFSQQEPPSVLLGPAWPASNLPLFSTPGIQRALLMPQGLCACLRRSAPIYSSLPCWYPYNSDALVPSLRPRGSQHSCVDHSSNLTLASVRGSPSSSAGQGSHVPLLRIPHSSTQQGMPGPWGAGRWVVSWSGGQGGNPAPNPSFALPSCETITKFPDT